MQVYYSTRLGPLIFIVLKVRVHIMSPGIIYSHAELLQTYWINSNIRSIIYQMTLIVHAIYSCMNGFYTIS